MSYQQLLHAASDRAAAITLNRSERHNALSRPLVDEIMATVAEADADPCVRVLVVTGAGGRPRSRYPQ
jgi:2-(1,2-epoxy-1,2-dihydrophenyl)acetyl-CoA isomerase